MYIPMAYPVSAFSSSRLGQLEILDVDDEELLASNLQAHIVAPEARARLLASDRHAHSSQSLSHSHSQSWGSGHVSSSPYSTPSSRYDDDSVDADTLLQDLARLAPSVAKSFLPKSHARDNFVFRLINDAEFVGEEQSYVALSYCWKKVQRDVPRKVISPIGDLPFGLIKEETQWPLPVREELWHACLGERERGEGIWFDQVRCHPVDLTSN